MARQSEAGRRHACSRGKSRSRGPSGDHTTEMASKAQLGLLLVSQVHCVIGYPSKIIGLASNLDLGRWEGVTP